MTPEVKFYRWLVRGTPSTWHWQRIETTTAQGVPDVNLYIPHLGEVWAELKMANPSTVLRPQQNAWIRKRQILGGNAIIMARKKHEIQIWNSRFSTELTKSGRLKITSKPNYTVLLPSLEKTFEKILTK